MCIGQPLARFLQHVGRRIDADDFGLRIARDQKLGGVARTAAEIDGKPRILRWHLRQQIARRAGALVLELQILARVPVIHRRIFPFTGVHPAESSLGGGDMRRADAAAQPQLSIDPRRAAYTPREPRTA